MCWLSLIPEEAAEQQSDGHTVQRHSAACRVGHNVPAVSQAGQWTGAVLPSQRGHTLSRQQDAGEGDSVGDGAGPGAASHFLLHPHLVASLQLLHVVAGVEGCVKTRHLSDAGHAVDPVDHEAPGIVVVSAAQLGSKHKLVDARDRCGEHSRVVVVAQALVHHHLVEDDWVVQDVSQRALEGCVKENSASLLSGCSLMRDLWREAETRGYVQSV